MQRRKFDRPNCRPYWIWDMPELYAEIPDLLGRAGQIELLGMREEHATVRVTLCQPAKVVPLSSVEEGKGPYGIWVNKDTFACRRIRPVVYMRTRPPRDGDTELTLVIRLQMNTFAEEETVSVDDAREGLRAFATEMTKTWIVG